ncbi:CGNR zinc finger domain-containing protein [uncultured Cellulomonas sp.]|uniref:CGNR zinc finger domain-containing protein n=1 Tax=uncultured Cellulomonas sp. TaxID=189682 RepID=UPI0028E5A357|nr:CGNR zinc finger domain-containing protein [uncultured Cellulomonas sp.]
MVFAPDTEMNLAAAVELVNTARRRDGHDAMATTEDVTEFYTRWSYTARHDGDAAELAGVRDARDQIAALWDVDRDTAAPVLNDLLARGGAVPFLTRHGDVDWHLHGTAPDASLATVLLVETAMAMADVVRTGEYDRLQRCAADDCDAVLVDLSRNRSRRFCDVNGCANRAHVAAYRARRAGHVRHGDVVTTPDLERTTPPR